MEDWHEQATDYTYNFVDTVGQLWLPNFIYDDCQCSDRIGDNAAIGLLPTQGHWTRRVWSPLGIVPETVVGAVTLTLYFRTGR